METQQASQPNVLADYIHITQAAEELGVHVGTLKRWKAERYGPKPFRLGKRVFYRRSDIAAWLEEISNPDRSRKDARKRA
jgi:predicted DNA-binding transcriptional regulator AlpA